MVSERFLVTYWKLTNEIMRYIELIYRVRVYRITAKYYRDEKHK